MHLVELIDVDKRYSGIRALRQISMTIGAGSLVHVAGANGAGKSTLLRVIAAVTRPSHGAVHVFGEDAFKASAASNRARVGYLGAASALYADLTVAENLRFSATLFGLDESAIGSQLQAMNLGEVADQKVGTLSFGYRRRVGLARALLNNPDLLLLDEPWNGLDQEAAKGLFTVLNARVQAGQTTLVAAHATAADPLPFNRVLQLERGRIVEDV